jgi:transmembrane sensor
MAQPNCTDDTDDTFLARWLNNELTDEELLNFKKSTDYELFERISRKSQFFNPIDFNVAENYALLQNKLQTIKSKTRVRKLYYQFTAGIAAVVALAFGLFQFLNQETVYISNIGEKHTYTLPDSSTVEMNGKAIIRLVEKDWKNNHRNLKLQGESYFNVKKGSAFTVKTNRGTVTVVGTQFNVQVIKDFFSVECYEGKVNVKKDLSQTLLLPGKGIRFQKDKMESFSIINAKPNWKTANYKYDGIPLFVVLNDLQNVYKVTIDTKNIDADQKFSGQLILNDLEKALLVICKPLQIEYQMQSKKVLLKQN